MKILLAHDGSPAHYFIRLGLSRAWQACGHEVNFWDTQSKSVFDVFDEFKPDLFWGQTYNLSRQLIQCISEYPLLKVVLRGSDWGPMQDSIDLQKYPVLVANDNERALVQKLQDKTGKPNFIHCHYHPNRIRATHGYWEEKMGVKIVGLHSAADIFDYTKGHQLEEFKCDVAFVGGYWGYKGQTLSKYIMPLCQVGKNYNVKIYGNQAWGCPQYCGPLPTEYVKHALASATICPNISEPHSQDFGYDIVERPYKLLSNKCFCISDYVDSMAKDVFTNDEIVFATGPTDFEMKVNHFLKNPDERGPYVDRGYMTVINSETYFHRIKTVFAELGMDNEAKKVDIVYADLRRTMKL